MGRHSNSNDKSVDAEQNNSKRSDSLRGTHRYSKRSCAARSMKSTSRLRSAIGFPCSSSAPSRHNEENAMPVYKEQIFSKPFYYGYMPREDVEIVIQNQGEFVVRRTMHKIDSFCSGFCISSKWNGTINHVVIRVAKNRDGMIAYFIEGPKFKTISDLINFYYYTGTSVWKHTEVKLLIPLHKADWVLHQKQLLPVKLLGAGNYGEVWECELTSYKEERKQMVAVKCLKGHKVPKAERSAFFGECRRLRQLSHPNLVTFIGMTIDTKPPKMVMELCEYSLTKYLTDTKRSSDWKQKCHICLQVALGMEYLSSERIIHRDLAARNCLLKKNVVKIADLGMAREGKFYKMEKSKPLPLKWTAPEAIKTLTFNEFTDVWSFGVLMWEVMTNAEVPYGKLEEAAPSEFCVALLEYIDKGGRLEPPQDTPIRLQRLMQACWNLDVAKRPNFSLARLTLQFIFDSLDELFIDF